MKKILEKSGKSQGILSEEKSGNPGSYYVINHRSISWTHDVGHTAFKLGSKYERLSKLPNLNTFSVMVSHLLVVYYFLSSVVEYETGKCQHFHLATFPLEDGTRYLWIMQKAHFSERFCPTFKDIYLKYSYFDPLKPSFHQLLQLQINMYQE